MNEIISLSLPTKLLRRIDSSRGDIPRSRYVLRILEKACSDVNILKSE